MSELYCGGSIVELDFVMAADRNALAMVSYYSRSLTTVKSIAAWCGMKSSHIDIKNVIDIDGTKRKIDFTNKDTFTGYFQPIVDGKEKFYHGLLINNELNGSMLIMKKGEEARILYNHLMEQFELPLLKEWEEPLYRWFKEKGKISSKELYFKGEYSLTESIPYENGMAALSQLYAVKVNIDETTLKDAVQNLFQKKEIRISSKEQDSLEFKNMDEYFSKYGSTMVANLEKQMEPLVELDGEAHDVCLKQKRLYPQQIAQMNGLVRRLETSSFAIANHGMGTGKTVLSAAVAESYFTRRWLKGHPGSTLADAYGKEGNVAYRNIVMCPPHLVEKWAEEIRSEVPYAKVEILRDFNQLVALRARGRKRTCKEWYVLSKDFCKMSFQYEPVPKTRRTMRVKGKVCNDCGKEVILPGSKCSCGSTNLRLVNTPFIETGMVCPHCKNLLVANQRQATLTELYEGDVDKLQAYGSASMSCGRQQN